MGIKFETPQSIESEQLPGNSVPWTSLVRLNHELHCAYHTVRAESPILRTAVQRATQIQARQRLGREERSMVADCHGTVKDSYRQLNEGCPKYGPHGCENPRNSQSSG